MSMVSRPSGRYGAVDFLHLWRGLRYGPVHQLGTFPIEPAPIDGARLFGRGRAWRRLNPGRRRDHVF